MVEQAQQQEVGPWQPELEPGTPYILPAQRPGSKERNVPWLGRIFPADSV